MASRTYAAQSLQCLLKHCRTSIENHCIVFAVPISVVFPLSLLGQRISEDNHTVLSDIIQIFPYVRTQEKHYVVINLQGDISSSSSWMMVHACQHGQFRPSPVLPHRESINFSSTFNHIQAFQHGKRKAELRRFLSCPSHVPATSLGRQLMRKHTYFMGTIFFP